MSVRNDIIINWDVSPRIITIASPSVEITAQDLYDTCRSLESSSEAMDNRVLVQAGGKEKLDDTTNVGITVTLRNALVAFETRLGPEYIQCNISGGNVVALEADLETYYKTPVSPTAFTQVVTTASSSATSSNSATIEYSSFNGGITYDVDNGYPGTGYIDGHAIGTPAAPSGIIKDAYTISTTRGLPVGFIRSNMDLTVANLIDDDLNPIVINEFVFYGASKDRTIITIEDAATVMNCAYINSKVTGYLDGQNKLYNCLIEDLTYIQGYVEECVLSGIGRITLSGEETSYFLGCYGGTNQPAIIDMGGSGQDLIMEEMWGEIQIENMTGALDSVYVLLGSGSVRVDLTSVTAGTIMIGGTGKLLSAADDSHLLSGEYNDGDLVIINETVGEALEMIRYLERNVYIDTEALINGDGSQAHPFNVQQDAADFAENNGIPNLVVRGDIVLDRQFKGFVIRGVGHPTISCNGQDLTGTEFYHCKLEDSYVGDIKAFECILLNGFYLNGGFNGCGTFQNLVAVDSANIVMKECFNANAGLYHTEISMNSGGISNLSLEGCHGRWTISDCDNILDVVVATVNGGHLIFDASCTTGNMVALGDCEFDDLATASGASVINRTSSKVNTTAVLAGEIETGFDLQEILRIIGASVGGKLSGAGTATITIRNLGDDKNVIIAGVDENGNRLTVTHDVS